MRGDGRARRDDLPLQQIEKPYLGPLDSGLYAVLLLTVRRMDDRPRQYTSLPGRSEWTGSMAHFFSPGIPGWEKDPKARQIRQARARISTLEIAVGAPA